MLDGVDLDYDSGLHLVLGPNGAGKTTLFRSLCGVLRPTRGRVLINGREPHHEAAAKALVGVSPHRPALAPRLSVLDNLAFWARVLALPAGVRERRVTAVVDLLSLAEIADRRAGTLSRGQSQRVGLAKALLNDPPVLLLDEPTSGVDPGMAAHLRRQLRSLADGGRTIVVSSHDLAEASDLADDVTILHRGRVTGRGAPAELRRELLGRGYRVRVRGSGDLRGALERLGHRATADQHDGVVVAVAHEYAVEGLVEALVRAGIGIREVTPAANPLEDIYTYLQEQETGHAAR